MADDLTKKYTKGTTERFIAYLKENGPQSYQHLTTLDFFGGVRTRIPKLIEQGRIVRVKMFNNGDSAVNRNVLAGFKATDLDWPKQNEDTVARRKETKNRVRDSARLASRIAAEEDLLRENGKMIISRILLEALLDGDSNVSLMAAKELRAFLKDSPE